MHEFFGVTVNVTFDINTVLSWYLEDMFLQNIHNHVSDGTLIVVINHPLYFLWACCIHHCSVGPRYVDVVRHSGGRFNIKITTYQYRVPHVKDYKNPLHIDVVDRYLRRMGDKTIPDEAPPSLESFYPPWVAGIDLPQSRCWGFFVSFTNKHK